MRALHIAVMTEGGIVNAWLPMCGDESEARQAELAKATALLLRQGKPTCDYGYTVDTGEWAPKSINKERDLTSGDPSANLLNALADVLNLPSDTAGIRLEVRVGEVPRLYVERVALCVPPEQVIPVLSKGDFQNYVKREDIESTWTEDERARMQQFFTERTKVD